MTDRDLTKLEDRIRRALTEEAAIIPPLDAEPAAAHLPDHFDAFYATQRGRLYRALVLSLRDRDLATEAVDVGMSRSFQRWRRVTRSGHADISAYAAAFKWSSKRTERSGGQHGFRLQRAERSADAVESGDGLRHTPAARPLRHRRQALPGLGRRGGCHQPTAFSRSA